MQCSTSIPTKLSEAENRLKPASATAGTAELMACLTLVAPNGMTAEDRNAWVQVARATLSGIPADLLAIGCKVVRKKCRFVSEIVPTIFETVQGLWDSRRHQLEMERLAYANRHAPRLESKPDYVAPDEVRKLIASLGLDAA